MAIEVVDLTEADIPGVIQVIQQAFADDPYFKWVFDELSVCMTSTFLPSTYIPAPRIIVICDKFTQTNIPSLP
jgi:hypothetical protein